MFKIASVLVSLFAFFLLFVSAGPALAEVDDDDTCCLCVSDGCCFLVDGNLCDAEGNPKHPDVLEDFFDLLGIDQTEFCNTCEQCDENQFSEEEDARFLDVCDLCVFEPSFEERQCRLAPPPVADDPVSGGGCRLGASSSNRESYLAFLGGLWVLGLFKLRCNLKADS